MPVASGHGKWPTEYGIGVQNDRISPKCAICTQKNCFSCEHTVTVRNAIFNHQPYLDPKEDFSIADRNDPKRRAMIEEQEKSSNATSRKSLQSNRKTNTRATNESDSRLEKKSKQDKKNDQPSPKRNQIKPEQTSETKEKKSKCTIL